MRRSASSLPPAPLKAALKPSSRKDALGLDLGLDLGEVPTPVVTSVAEVAETSGARSSVSGSRVFTSTKSTRNRKAARKHGARLDGVRGRVGVKVRARASARVRIRFRGGVRAGRVLPGGRVEGVRRQVAQLQ